MVSCILVFGSQRPRIDAEISIICRSRGAEKVKNVPAFGTKNI